MNRDRTLLRDLVLRYREHALAPEMEMKRRLWAAHHSLKPTRPLILATFGMWNVWCADRFGDAAMECEDPFYREYERTLKMALFQVETGDDSVLEPWLTVRAAVQGDWRAPWGLVADLSEAPERGGARTFQPPIREWVDASALRAIPHIVDEAETARRVEKLAEAVGDLLPIDIHRGPFYAGFAADISTFLIRLRGLNEIMLDMYEHPAELHRVLAFMRDGILANNRQAEEAGHYTLTCGNQQAPPYAEELPRPQPNSEPVKRSALWGFCAAQEYTLVSPAQHEEFLFRYQRPIMEPFGLVHYGCCEDLTEKIGMLRQLPNLRSIAVTPSANVGRCAEAIGRDYVISWRPNPSDMVCTSWDEDRIRRILREGANALRGTVFHVHLKDVETVQGEPDRLRRWTALARDVLEQEVGGGC